MTPGTGDGLAHSDPRRYRDMVDPATARAFRAAGWWGDLALADLVEDHAGSRPDGAAFVTVGERMTWAGYRDSANRLAAALVECGISPGDKMAVMVPDGPSVHVALLANEKAGLVSVGIGARAGDREIRHLLQKTGAVGLITHDSHRGADSSALADALRRDGIALAHHVVIPRFEAGGEATVRVDGRDVHPGPVTSEAFAGRRLGPDDLFLINSTSGTTGLPKCVMHSQNSKLYMARQAREVADLGAGEVLLGLAPMPFGFGVFTTHFVAATLGAPAVVMDRFDADTAVELIERERATVLVCVSTQFKMMLNSPEVQRRDLSSLRVMFTGGEMIPYEAAREFEERTGAYVLNFYGANESGVVTGTRVQDPQHRRLSTAGRLVPGTEMRLFDDGVDVTGTGRGQPGSRGPALCLGYYDDPDANAMLLTEDGFVLHADIVTVDEEGYLSVVGRKSEIIIRGGKNISASVVEDAVSSHPAVALAAAVPMPDPVFGERVCVFAQLRPGCALDLPELTAFLDSEGVSKEYFPERLVVLAELPRSSGGKVAKGQLTEEAGRLAVV